VKSLLQADLTKRFGNLKAGSDDILQSKWISGIDLRKLIAKQIPAPYKPLTKDDKDVSNFEDIQDSGEVPPAVPASQDPFKDW
jgi:protein kinase A